MTSTTPDNTRHEPRRIPTIGIVGGIGSGKSAVAQWVAARANVLVIDADRLGHQALRSDEVKAALRQRFGGGIFNEHGEVARHELGKLVFGDDEICRTARRDLEHVVHPAIERMIEEAIIEATRKRYDAVLLDAAVLFEAAWQTRCDAVVFVDAPEEVRWRRVQARSNWTLDELRKREASQLPISEKQKLCDALISNAHDDSRGGQELMDFLWGRWGICCKPSPNSSKHSLSALEILPP
jgi:dephospho-CoA kinase